MEPEDLLQTALIATLQAQLREKEAEVERLNRLRTHCPDCGADYMATGIEAGCPCKLQGRIDSAIENLGGFLAGRGLSGGATLENHYSEVCAYADRLQAENAALKAELYALELWIRKCIWASHGCDGLYGDDGELQCNNIERHGKPLDFKNMELREVFEVDLRCRMEKVGIIASRKEGK